MTITVPVSAVQPDKKQPRRYFKEQALRALATSIKKTGQRQPITVRKRRAGASPPYEIIDGERRWRACQIAGIPTIRVDIEGRDLAHHPDQHLLSLASNFMREGHTHIEISEAVKYQVDASVAAGLTRGEAVTALCDAIGKSDAWVYQYLQLQLLHGELQEKMHPETEDTHRLRLAEAVVLAPLPHDQQLAIYRKLLCYPAGVRAQAAKRMAVELAGAAIKRRSHNLKVSTNRFVVRVAAEIDRMLDYKQAEFRAALSSVSPDERKSFRASLAMLLTEVDAVMADEGCRAHS